MELFQHVGVVAARPVRVAVSFFGRTCRTDNGLKLEEGGVQRKDPLDFFQIRVIVMVHNRGYYKGGLLIGVMWYLTLMLVIISGLLMMVNTTGKSPTIVVKQLLYEGFSSQFGNWKLRFFL